MKILTTILAGILLALTSCSGAAGAKPSSSGSIVSVQQLGDTRVTTRRLINRELTNKDIGKVYEEITLESPRGRTVQQRVIVRAQPSLETTSVSKR